MSVNFFDADNGFCNCGAELLSWYEVQDGECDSCANALNEEACVVCSVLHDGPDSYCDDCLELR